MNKLNREVIELDIFIYSTLKNTSNIIRNELHFSDSLLQSADSAVQNMAQTFEEIGFQVVPESAQWIGSLSLKGKSENTNARIIINAEGQGGLVVLRPTEDPQPEWTETLDDWLMVDEEQEKEIEKEVQMMIEQDHPEISSISMHRYPKLRFQVQRDSEIFTVDVRHRSGLTIFETEGSQNLRTKMLRLHTMHGDPGYTGAKWIWVKIVDIVGVAMIVWGFSGLIMWWTIRPTRRQGAVAIAIGVGLMVVLSTTLWSIYGY